MTSFATLDNTYATFFNFTPVAFHLYQVPASHQSPFRPLLSPFLLVLSPFVSPLLSPFLLVIVSALSCLLSCLPSCWSLCPVLSPFLVITASVLSVFCYLLSPFLSPFSLVPLFGGHCVRLISLLFPLSPFLSPLLVIVSTCFFVPPVLSPLLLVTVSVLFLFWFLLSPFCLPSCWSLCPPCLPSCLPLSPVLSPFLLVTVSVVSPFLCLNLAQFLFAAANQLKGPVQPKQQRRCINCTQYTLATTAEIHTRLIYRCVAGFTVQVVQRQPSNSIPRGAVNHAIPCRILKTSQVRLLHLSSWLPSRMRHCSRHSQGHFPVS